MTECIHLTDQMRRECLTCNPYPYTHAGPAIHGSKLNDYLITEARMLEDGDLELVNNVPTPIDKADKDR